MISKTGSLEAGQQPGRLIPFSSFRGTIEDPGAFQLSALPSAHSPCSPATCPPGYKTAAGAPAVASFLHVSRRQINLHQKPHTTLPFAISLVTVVSYCRAQTHQLWLAWALRELHFEQQRGNGPSPGTRWTRGAEHKKQGPDGSREGMRVKPVTGRPS